MKHILKSCFFLLLVGAMALCGLQSSVVQAAQIGAPETTDFQLKNLYLGDSTEKMLQLLGEPMFDTDMMQAGVNVKRYTYSPKFKVYVSQATGKVLQIYSQEKDYVARDGVTYGATRAKLYQVYGSSEHRNLDGNIYYIYRNPEYKNQKLLMQMDTNNYYLISITVTALPLDETEAEGFDEGNSFSASWRDSEGPKFQYHLSKNISIGN